LLFERLQGPFEHLPVGRTGGLFHLRQGSRSREPESLKVLATPHHFR
jgi:hypothetical protein